MECYRCHREGHRSWECQVEIEPAASQPPPAQHLAQHADCPRCRALVYAWDSQSACGAHIRILGPGAPHIELPASADSEFRRTQGYPHRTDTQLRQMAMDQLAESRADPSHPANTALIASPAEAVTPLDRWTYLPGDPPAVTAQLRQRRAEREQATAPANDHHRYSE